MLWFCVGATACAPVAERVPLVDGAVQQAVATPRSTGEGPSAAPAADPSPEPTATALSPAPVPAAATAVTLLATIEVKGRAPKTGYDRDLFGDSWSDVDRNGCDTRNDILARDLSDETYKPGTRDCVVVSGQLVDPYTARTLSFTKADASAVQIDHVVALSNAWQTGAQQWSADRRLTFANNPLNLLAVDGPTNASKGDGDAATWLPPSKTYRCPMLARQIAVKAKYGLWVVPPEHDAMIRILSACPAEPVPTDRTLDVGPAVALAEPAPPAPTSEQPPHPPAPGHDGGTDPQFASCKQARANGLGPYLHGQDEEYGWYRDGDSDGSVCE